MQEDIPMIQLGISLETEESLRNLRGAAAMEEERQLDSAKGIAQDLFNFMASFAQTSGYDQMTQVIRMHAHVRLMRMLHTPSFLFSWYLLLVQAYCMA